MIRSTLPLLLLSLLGCTNYSSSTTVQIPPLLVSAVNNGNSNFTLKVRATNPELIFQGYRLFTGPTENDAINQGDLNAGTDCSVGAATMTALPVQPREYIFEIDPSVSLPVSGIDCKFRVALTSGTYISVRTLGLSIRVQAGTSSLRVSGPSNAILLP
jgi:hypothetical protein